MKPSVDVFVPEDWEVYRDTRLAALKDAPYAFGTTYAQASQYPDNMWHERLLAVDPGQDLPVKGSLGDVVSGMSAGHLEETGVVHIYQMWVSPHARGTGLARLMLGYIADWAEGLGVRDLELDVTIGNDAAIALYESAGFVATGYTEKLREGSDKIVQRMSMTRSN